MLRFDDRSPDARTIDVCIAPYREVATVNDGAGPYQEKFLPGAFRDQVEARSTPLRIWLDLEHQKNTVIGHATGLSRARRRPVRRLRRPPRRRRRQGARRHPRRHAHRCLDEGDPDPLARGRRRHPPPESPPHRCRSRRRLGLLAPGWWGSAKQYAASRQAPPRRRSSPCGIWSGSTGSYARSRCSTWMTPSRCGRSGVVRAEPAGPGRPIRATSA